MFKKPLILQKNIKWCRSPGFLFENSREFKREIKLRKNKNKKRENCREI